MHRYDFKADRGATLVEYAMAIALIVVVSIGVVSRLQSESEEKLGNDAGRVGSVEDNAFYASGATTTTVGSGTTTTTAGTTAVHPSQLTATPPSSNDGNKWIGSVTVKIEDGAGNAVGGVLVTGNWTDPSPTTTTSCTTTAPSGTCSMQRTDIQDSKPTATFGITAISGTGFTWTPSGTDATTVIVNCPGSAVTCD